VTLVGAAHAPSPGVRGGHPGHRTLEAVCAPASMPPQVSHAGSRGIGNPSLTVVAQEWFVREAHV